MAILGKIEAVCDSDGFELTCISPDTAVLVAVDVGGGRLAETIPAFVHYLSQRNMPPSAGAETLSPYYAIKSIGTAHQMTRLFAGLCGKKYADFELWTQWTVGENLIQLEHAGAYPLEKWSCKVDVPFVDAAVDAVRATGHCTSVSKAATLDNATQICFSLRSTRNALANLSDIADALEPF